jgi:tetratricopeptide (TPR) repeat protein
MLACVLSVTLQAQDKSLVRKGNELYQQKKYKEAIEAYQQALQQNPNSIPGLFNLGNALYQGKQTEPARKMMAAAEKNAKDKTEKSGAEYNLGNTYMDERKWDDAISYYKQALRNNPQDADAKYNLSYALAMKKKEDGGGGKDKNKDKKDDKDKKDKDKKDKDDKGKQDQDKKDQQNKDQDKKDGQDKQDQQQQPRPGNLTQKQAEEMLNALMQDEKVRQDKLQKAKGVPVKVQKDW